jgi:hypothetical protein
MGPESTTGPLFDLGITLTDFKIEQNLGKIFLNKFQAKALMLSLNWLKTKFKRKNLQLKCTKDIN